MKGKEVIGKHNHNNVFWKYVDMKLVHNYLQLQFGTQPTVDLPIVRPRRKIPLYLPVYPGSYRYLEIKALLGQGILCLRSLWTKRKSNLLDPFIKMKCMSLFSRWIEILSSNPLSSHSSLQACPSPDKKSSFLPNLYSAWGAGVNEYSLP